jgi:hypothetical protein
MGLLRFEFSFLVFSLVFNMAPATFKVIKCSDFRMKKILKRVNLPLRFYI